VGHADTIGTVNLARGHQIRQRLRPERVFVLLPPETLRRRLFRGKCHCEDRRWTAVPPAAIKGKVRPSRSDSSRYPERSVMEGILVATTLPPL
jgi:hypothetical protein